MTAVAARAETGAASWLGDLGVFAMFHPARRPAARVGVVLCSPFGWDEVASYRSRREWALRLAAAGYPCMRFDWPGAGDSAGSPADSHRLDAWCAALDGVARRCQEASEVETIAAIGIGLGGLLAVEAIRRGAPLSEVVLWGAPRDGRAFTRAERAFAGLQDAKLAGEIDPLLPEGWIESGGYVISAETIASLRTVDLKSGAPGLRRVLLLDQDGLEMADDVPSGLRAQGVQVEVGSGPGYGRMVHRAETTELPGDVVAAVSTWLAGAGGDPVHERSASVQPETPAAGAPMAPSASSLELESGRERVLEIAHDDGTAFAVISLPNSPRPGAPTLVMLPGWATRRSGPNRLWTEIARSACGKGFTAVRVDLPGVGDAEGDRTWLSSPNNATDPRIIDEVGRVLDRLATEGLGEQFVLAGVSSGGFWAYKTLVEDPRVCAAAVMNTAAHLLDPSLHARLAVRKARALLQPVWWWRILRGEVRLQQTMAWSYLKRRLRQREALATSAPVAATSLRDTFDAIQARGDRLTFGFSLNEEMRKHLEREGITRQLSRWPGIRLEDIAGLDHNARSLPAQQDVRRLVGELLEAIAAGSG